jgi:hypothetical protein
MDIGGRGAVEAEAFERVEVRVEQIGWAPAPQISKAFAEAICAFVDYYPGYLAKSGIFAAAAAHGTPAVLLRNARSEEDGLHIGDNYLLLESMASREAHSTCERIPAVSQSAFAWYQGHSVERHAEELGRLVDVALAAGQIA